MKNSLVTKTLNKLNSDKVQMSAKTQNWSIGFLRYFVMPETVKKKIGKDWLFEKGNTLWYEPLKAKLNEMSNEEYKNWLIQL